MVATVEIDPCRDERWAALATGAEASLFHSPPWLRALASTYAWSPRADVVLDDAGAPVAGCAWCRIDEPSPRIVSLPFSDFAGPIGADRHRASLLGALVARGLPVRWRERHDRSPTDHPGELVGRARWHGIRVADGDVAIAPAAGRAVRKARRDGVTVELAGDDGCTRRFLDLHTRVRRHKYGMLPQPLEFFDALRDEFSRPLGAPAGWYPLEARLDGRVVAATIYVRWGDTLFYKFNASDPDALAHRPNDLLLEAGAQLAVELGCRLLDLGASDDDQPGLIRFKRGHGADEGEIRTFRAGPAPSPGHADAMRVLGAVTRELTASTAPDAVMQLAGSTLYRYFA